MAQDQKSGSAAAQKALPKAAASATANKAVGGPPPLPLPSPAAASSDRKADGAPKAEPPLAAAKAESAKPEGKFPGVPAASDSLSLIIPPSAMTNLGSATAAVAHPLPPPLPQMAARTAGEPTLTTGNERAADKTPAEPVRRMARRRPAGPPRQKIAANDDAPSIGGLIYALEQKPATTPFKYAAIASAGWAAICLVFSWIIVRAELEAGATLVSLLEKPATFLTVTAIIVPIAVLWALALLAWRSDELRLRSSTMTEVAIRLAEPDRMAEQSVASLGQAVRRQVSFMNDAISRALGRAGELEALVHNEVTALERSYEENERKIRGLIQELTGERVALVNTGDKVAETLRTLGTEVPTLIEKLSSQQVKLATIIQGAGENLNNLEGALSRSTGQLETTLGTRTQHLQSVLEDYTGAIGHALGARTEQMQLLLGTYSEALGGALEQRTESMQKMLDKHASTLTTALDTRSQNMQTVFEEYTRALDTTIASRAAALDSQLVERTKTLDSAFSERLRLFDESIQRSTLAIDSSVNEKALALTSALDQHAKSFADTVDKQAGELDEALMRGINSVRRSSENITRQSMKAIEGLAGQSELLKSVSENLLGQIHSVTSRFEKQGQHILGAASALETVNFKIDTTLQNRHADMNRTLDRLSNKADEFGRFLEGYSASIEGSLTEAEVRARAAAEELKKGTETQQRAAIADLKRMQQEADAESERALADLRSRFSNVSNEMSQQLGSLSARFDETSEQVRKNAARTAQELAEEQARLRREVEQLPSATRESADAVRRALQDQLKALDQLSSFTSRTAGQRDVMPPLPLAGARPAPGQERARSVPSLSTALAQELVQRQRPGERPAGQPTAATVAAQAGRLVPANPAAGAAGTGGADSRAGWSLGDLLARASHDQEEDHGAPAAAAAQQAGSGAYILDIHTVARALDAAAASAIWGRLRTGQRGIMARSIYSSDGRNAFDEISRRYKSDADLRVTIDRYMQDFEGLLRDSDAKDPSGQQAQSQIISDGGRVYLFLAHATGRLS